MLHPDIARALATAHIEDLHRAATRSRTIRFARSTRLRGRRAPQVDGTPQAGSGESGFIGRDCDGGGLSGSEVSRL